MIDTLTVLVSHGLLAYILFRAVVLDQTLPWFEPAERNRDQADKNATNDKHSTAGQRQQPRARGSARRFQPRFRNNPPA